MGKIRNFWSKAFIVCSVSLMLVAPVNADGEVKQSNHVIIEKGDTLFSLSQKYHTTISTLKNLNNLTSNTIYIGQQLTIPKEDDKITKVMVGSFKEKKNAQKRAEFLQVKDIAVFVSEKNLGKETYYRVQAGAYSERDNAVKQLSKVREAGIRDAYLLTESK